MAGRNYLLNCEILHEIRGRIRIRSRALKYLGVHKEEITKRLMQVHYIKSVEISTITGSVLIYFDNFSLTGENFVSLLQNTLNGYLVDIYKNEKKQASNKYVKRDYEKYWSGSIIAFASGSKNEIDWN